MAAGSGLILLDVLAALDSPHDIVFPLGNISPDKPITISVASTSGNMPGLTVRNIDNGLPGIVMFVCGSVPHPGIVLHIPRGSDLPEIIAISTNNAAIILTQLGFGISGPRPGNIRIQIPTPGAGFRTRVQLWGVVLNP